MIFKKHGYNWIHCTHINKVLHRPGLELWLKTSWPGNNKPEMSILKYEIFVTVQQVWLTPGKYDQFWFWVTSILLPTFCKGGNTSFAFLRRHHLWVFVSWFWVKAHTQVCLKLHNIVNFSFGRALELLVGTPNKRSSTSSFMWSRDSTLVACGSHLRESFWPWSNWALYPSRPLLRCRESN